MKAHLGTLDKTARIDATNVLNVQSGQFENLTVDTFCQIPDVTNCFYLPPQALDIAASPDNALLVTTQGQLAPQVGSDLGPFLLQLLSPFGNRVLARSPILSDARGVTVDDSGQIFAAFPISGMSGTQDFLIRFPANFPSALAQLIANFGPPQTRGMGVDQQNRIYVTMDALGTLTPAAVAVFDHDPNNSFLRFLNKRLLDRSDISQILPVGTRQGPNDVAVDPQGNVYVTSTELRFFGNLPYTVARVTRYGEALTGRLPRDGDDDGIPDDGNGSGFQGDRPCADGQDTSCDDNCPLVSNPAQADTDMDGIGDACDPSTALADLEVAAVASPDPVTAGSDLTYTVVVTNHGPTMATDLQIVNTLPEAIANIRCTACDSCTAATGKLTCPQGDLASGASSTWELVLTPTAAGVLSNTVAVVSATPDPQPTNNTATVSTTVKTSADLAVTKLASPDPVTVGSELTYTVTVTNNGPSSAMGVGIVDTLPTGITNFSCTECDSCTLAGDQLTCSDGVLDSGATLILVLALTPMATGDLSNTVAVASTTPDADPANNTATVTTTVSPSVHTVSLSKAFNLFSYPAAVPADRATCQGLLASLGAPDEVVSMARFNTLTQRFETCDVTGLHSFPIKAGEGYVIRMKADRIGEFPGNPTCPDLTLSEGLNLIGHPMPPDGMTCFLFLQRFEEGLVTSMQRFNPTTGMFETCAFFDNGGGTVRPTGIDFPIVAGEGYLVNARATVTTALPGCNDAFPNALSTHFD